MIGKYYITGMTDNELEDCIKKALRISFTPGTYSLFSSGSDIPGQIGIVFKPQDVSDYLKFSEYMREEYKDFKKTIYISQVAPDKIDFIFMVEKEPATILKVAGLLCKPEAVSSFFKKQPKDKSILLFAHLLQSHDAFAPFILKDPGAESIPLIYLHSWNGKAF
ncbi:MAG: hypothetical protein QM737_20395 [Ferruginibacter sp.]